MTLCDGSPGEPGVYDVPSEDGLDVVACTGCAVCRPLSPSEVMDEVMSAVGKVVDAAVVAMGEISRAVMGPPPKNRALRRALKYGHPVAADRKVKRPR
ncbi:MAG: hypothetical protein AB7L09_22080 [Nitrospira sp.]